VVVDFVRMERARVHPCSRFDARDLQSRARQWQHRHASGRSQADYGYINRLELGGHGVFYWIIDLVKRRAFAQLSLGELTIGGVERARLLLQGGGRRRKLRPSFHPELAGSRSSLSRIPLWHGRSATTRSSSFLRYPERLMPSRAARAVNLLCTR